MRLIHLLRKLRKKKRKEPVAKKKRVVLEVHNAIVGSKITRR